jgi:MFS family permease
MAWTLVVLGIGFGLITAPTNAAAVDAVPAARRGVAGGLVILARLMGLAVGLSGLTAWALHRFDTLRRSVVLPPIDDPAYGDALAEAQGRLTADALSETFLFSAALAVAALAVALLLRRHSADEAVVGR